jgi:hypothetical protein
MNSPLWAGKALEIVLPKTVCGQVAGILEGRFCRWMDDRAVKKEDPRATKKSP